MAFLFVNHPIVWIHKAVAFFHQSTVNFFLLYLHNPIILEHIRHEARQSGVEVKEIDDSFQKGRVLIIHHDI